MSASKVQLKSPSLMSCAITAVKNSCPAATLSTPNSRHIMGPQLQAATQTKKILLAFDFDHTIVDGNTDTWVAKAAPGGDLPRELKSSYERGRWTDYMQRVLAYLHQEGVTVAQMQTKLQQLPYTAGMHQLWQQLQSSNNCCCIILSDSNSQFIDWILGSRGHSHIFSNIYTNSAVVSDNGQLMLSPCHAHSCSICPCNMCKRVLLQHHQQQSQQFERVLYIGDGSNDLCPVQALTSKDIAFVRAEYALDKLLQHTAVASTVAAEVVQWHTAHDIIQRLKQL